MRPVIALCALLFLAACATPREQCIRNVTSELRATNAQISELQGNIARGYAIHRQQVPYIVPNVCYNSAGVAYACPQTMYRTVETPVAIDVSEQRRRLAELQTTLPALQSRAAADTRQCEALNPE